MCSLQLERLEDRRLLTADFGDAPAPYPTLEADDGATHTVVAGFHLGLTVDTEPDGQPSLEGNSDDRIGLSDDEDGVTNVGGGGLTITGGLRRGDNVAQWEVSVTNTAGIADPYLDAWLDFNQDGDWDDAGERIASQAVAAGMNTITFAVPDEVELGETFARFRLHAATGPGLLPTGPATEGEVEDHRVLVTVDGDPYEVAKLLASDAREGSEFGWSVSVSGDTAVIGTAYGGSAYVFTRAGNTWSEQAKLTPSFPEPGDFFGYSVSVSGDTVVIGAPENDDAGYASGLAYVFTRSGNTWSEQAKLTPSFPEPGDWFGYSVSVWGDTVVIGAPRNFDAGYYESGSAYVFTRSGNTWSEQAELLASDAAAGDHFGVSVSVWGDTAVIGAPGQYGGGSAYVFTRSGNTWSEQAKLTPSEATAPATFGCSVSVSGDTVVIGDPEGYRFLESGGYVHGSAYIFTRSSNTWSEQAVLPRNADDPWEYNFSGSVAVSGDIVVIGAFHFSYVFTRSGNTWSEQAKLTGSETAGDTFGCSVSVSGDTVVIGAPEGYRFFESGGCVRGSAYIFTRSGNTWSEQAVLPRNADDSWEYGSGGSVAVSGDTVVIGAFHFAYVFTRSGNAWSEQAKLTASEASGRDLRPFIVAVSGDNVVIGHPHHQFVDPRDLSSAYVFHIDMIGDPDFGDAPAPYPTLEADDGAWHSIVAGFCLGNSIDPEMGGRPSLEGNSDDRIGLSDDDDGVTKVGGGGLTITGGLRRGDSVAQWEVSVTNTAGIADPYLDAWLDFNQDGDWDDAGERIASQAVAAGMNTITFAVPDEAALGETFARFRLHAATGPGLLPTGPATEGEVEDHRVLVTVDGDPYEVAKLLASDAREGGEFGWSVSVSGDTAVIGTAYGDSAYVFTRSGNTWSEQAKLTPSVQVPGDFFGDSVSVSGDTVVIGAPRIGNESGAAYVFTRVGNTWSEQAKLTPSVPYPSSFGDSVSVSGDTIVIGASGYYNESSGAAYVFTRSGNTWSEQSVLLASDAAAGDHFGGSVSVWGDTVVIGAPGDDDAGDESGSAYIFTCSGNTWSEQAKLTASEATAGASFGCSVSVSGDTVVTGSAGSAYVFTRSGNAWTQQAELLSNDFYYYRDSRSVAVWGDTVVIGSTDGLALLFTRSGNTWFQQAMLTPGGGEPGEWYGFAVAVSGNTVVIGVPLDDEAGDASGAAYMFKLDGAADFGDAPVPYLTLRANNGPRHIIGGPQLGSAVDAESDGQSNAVATGDGRDEDGVHFGDLLFVGQSADIKVTSSPGGGNLDFFIDFNANGQFGDVPSEVFQAAVSGGTETVSISVPPDAVPGTTYGRFRISSAGGLGPLSWAPDGEVEDYQLMILPAAEMICDEWEYFDGVTAPDLPPGWTNWSSGADWVTLDVGSDTPPNHAYVASPGTFSENTLMSPSVDTLQTGIRRLQFRNYYDLQTNWDGGVLEISIDRGPRQDIIAAGGSFVAGGYTGNLLGALGARSAWTGNSGGYIDTIVDLPPAAWGREVQFFWLEGTACSETSTGWHIDTIQLCRTSSEFDYGDAPDPTYATLSSHGGAAHLVGGWGWQGLCLGTYVDSDGDGHASTDGMGDDYANSDDEDGVTFTSALIPGATATVDVVVTKVGLLSAWIDFNGDGDWWDPGEQVFQDLLVTAGVNQLAFTVPADARATQSFARFRVSTQSGLSFDGVAPDGEVEDYQVTIDATVVGRHVFYNRSAWDGNNAAANAADDNAIATDKRALCAGEKAAFASYTSYSRGINGIMVDIAGLADPAGLSVADFEFRVGNSNNPASWPLLSLDPALLTLAVRSGAGVGGSDRVTIIFPDGAVKKTWLQVTVKATAATGLSAPDVHYWGNAIGDSGNATTDTAVNVVDALGVRVNPHTLLNPAPIDFRFDFNRDKQVNVQDELIVRVNPTTLLTDLNLIDLTGYGGDGAEGEGEWSGDDWTGQPEVDLSSVLAQSMRAPIQAAPSLPLTAASESTHGSSDAPQGMPEASLPTRCVTRSAEDLLPSEPSGAIFTSAGTPSAYSPAGVLVLADVQVLALTAGVADVHRPRDHHPVQTTWLSPSTPTPSGPAIESPPVGPVKEEQSQQGRHRTPCMPDGQGRTARHTLDEALQELLAEWGQY